MVSLNATFLDDLGRVRLELVDPEPNVRYRVQRSTEDEPTWVPVRGAQHMSTVSATIVDDYEYAPNIENRYRIVAPSFYDSFNRVYPVGGALQLTGNGGSHAWTPDSVGLDIVDDITIAIDLTLDTWQGSMRGLVAKWVFTGGNRSYLFTLEAGGELRLWWSTDGTSGGQEIAQSSLPVPVGSGRLAVRATRNAGTGDVTFYTASSFSFSESQWVQLGDVQSSTPDLMFSGNALLEIGAWNDGSGERLEGIVHRMNVSASLTVAASTAANPDFNTQTPGTTNFNDGIGNPWTVDGDAEIIEFAPLIGFDWGTADTGQNWNLGSSSPGFGIWVDNGVGVIQSGNSPGGDIAEMVTDAIPGAEDAEIHYTVTVPQTSIDARAEFNLGLRATFFTDRYEARIFFDPDQAVVIRIDKFVGGSFGNLGTQVTVGTWSPGVFWNVRFRVVGSNLLMRAWKEGHDEPVNWQVARNDTDLTTGNAVYVRTRKDSGGSVIQWFGPMELNTVPQTVADTAIVTPTQEDVFLKSIQYPLFNKLLECVDWQELTRESRVGFHNVKGRHQILGIADVGSSATFELTFITRSKAENRAVVALLTYGGLLLIQPPGDDDSADCPVAYSGIPGGYVMPGESVQARTVYGKPIWQWTVEFTRVADADAADIVPTTITWTQLWNLIGDEGTWQDVWDTWPTWQALWLTNGNPETFGDIEG